MKFALLLAAASLAPALDDPADDTAVPPLTEADLRAIAAVEALGGQVVPLALNDARLDVSYHLGDVTLTAERLDALKPLADRLHGLNLRGTAFDDKLSAKLTAFPKLRRLHLERTQITDGALISVGTLESLEYLNLYGTEVTDDGLTRLRSLKSLQSLYVWDTGVTADGVLAFKAALPDVEVVGVELPPEPRRPLVAPKPDPTPAADD